MPILLYNIAKGKVSYTLEKGVAVERGSNLSVFISTTLENRSSFLSVLDRLMQMNYPFVFIHNEMPIRRFTGWPHNHK